MMTTRRTILKTLGAGGLMMSAWATQVTKFGLALAAWDKTAFQTKSPADAIKDIGAADAVQSNQIELKAPDIAENGAVVPIQIVSSIPNTDSITIVTQNNPFPLTAIFNIENGAEPYVSTRIKIGKTGPVKAFVKANGKYYVASRDVKVTIGGCGG